jgi:hybrid cluster-associated redox disulfide protein
MVDHKALPQGRHLVVTLRTGRRQRLGQAFARSLASEEFHHEAERGSDRKGCAGTKTCPGGGLPMAWQMEAIMFINYDTLVDDVMEVWPVTIRVFLDFRFGCVGCPIATFHTVDDACREHGIEREVFLQALRVASP